MIDYKKIDEVSDKLYNFKPSLHLHADAEEIHCILLDTEKIGADFKEKYIINNPFVDINLPNIKMPHPCLMTFEGTKGLKQSKVIKRMNAYKEIIDEAINYRITFVDIILSFSITNEDKLPDAKISKIFPKLHIARNIISPTDLMKHHSFSILTSNNSLKNAKAKISKEITALILFSLATVKNFKDILDNILIGLSLIVLYGGDRLGHFMCKDTENMNILANAIGKNSKNIQKQLQETYAETNVLSINLQTRIMEMTTHLERLKKGLTNFDEIKKMISNISNEIAGNKTTDMLHEMESFVSVIERLEKLREDGSLQIIMSILKEQNE